jgi:hypothetical protein
MAQTRSHDARWTWFGTDAGSLSLGFEALPGCTGEQVKPNLEKTH